MPEPRCLKAALEYAGRGWPVLALTPNSKIPVSDKTLQPNGSLSASTDLDHLATLFNTYPLANLGIATGSRSGLTVIDLDGKEAADALLEAGLTCPPTFTIKTPRGYHRYIQYNPDLKQTAGLLEKLDVRNEGGYVVAPPSTVNEIEYSVFDNSPIASWPEIAELSRTESVPTTTGSDPHPSWVASLLSAGTGQGQRNESATRLAGYFRSVGLPQDVAIAALQGFADRCSPPLDAKELQTVIASVWRYQPTRSHTYRGSVMDAPIMDASSQTARIFRWPESGVMVRVERLRDTGRRLECWITIATASLGKVYGPVGLDLLSTTQRDGLRRTLKDRDEQDWTAIIQHVADLVIQSLDPAEDLIDMGSYKRQTKSPWLAEPFVRDQQPYLVYSDGGEGKTTFMLALMLTLAGVPVLPGIHVAEPITSMMLDWEADKDETSDTLAMLAAGVGAEVPKDRILYRRFSGTLLDHMDAIQRDVTEHNVRFTGTDSLIAAFGESDRPSSAARDYFNAMRTLGVASWGITHLTLEGKAKPYGSAFYWNLARGVWRLRRDQEDGSSEADIGLFQEKFNRGGRVSPIGYRATYEDDKISFKRAEVGAMPEVGKKAGVPDQIAAVLSSGNLTLPKIYDELPHVDEATIRQALNRKTRTPRFQNNGLDGWGLVTRHNVTEYVTTGRNVTEETPTGVFPPASQLPPPEIRLPYKETEETPWKDL